MSDLDRYLDAATRENTRASYAKAIRHFEVEGEGLLPATADQVAKYLARFAASLAISTLRQRVAALSAWHRDHGFPDPTKAPVVRKVLKGIQTVHPAAPRQAAPLQLTLLGQLADWLDEAAQWASSRGDVPGERRHRRDRALVLVGFWRAFRTDELLRLEVQNLTVVEGQGMTCFLPQSKGDRQAEGVTFRVPALSRWCPVDAMVDWLTVSELTTGPVFRSIDAHGAISTDGLHANSIPRLLREIFARAGLASPEQYSGHSLRRGFAQWANAQGWDLKSLMEYVGWKDVSSAMRYLDGADPFAKHRIEAGLPERAEESRPSLTARPVPEVLPAPRVPLVDLEVRLVLSNQRASRSGSAKVRKILNDSCLAPLAAQQVDADGQRFHFSLPDDELLEETVAELLDDLHRFAGNHHFHLDADVRERSGSRRWE